MFKRLNRLPAPSPVSIKLAPGRYIRHGHTRYEHTNSRKKILSSRVLPLLGVFAVSSISGECVRRHLGGRTETLLFAAGYADSLSDAEHDRSGGRATASQHIHLVRSTEPRLSLENARKALVKSSSITDVEGITTHSASVSSNSPCEDTMSAGLSPASAQSRSPWAFWGVFDGHAGYHTAAVLCLALPGYVLARLAQNEDASMSSAIKSAFLDFDTAIMDSARTALESSTTPADPAAMAALAPAIAGSCALFALYNHESHTLFVANVGDSRAVLGRWSAVTGQYAALPLSTDQTGFSASERTRMAAAHPNEDPIIDASTGRTAGIAVTRAFGDHRWKWADDVVNEVHRRFWGPKARPGNVIRTPPYLTAEPEIEEVDIKVGGRDGDFLILASDGFWDHVSNEVAVECVQGWLDRKRRGDWASKPDEKVETSCRERQDGDIGIYYDEKEGLVWKVAPEHFVFEQENAATCLIQNAFGGCRRDLFCSVIGAQPSISRDVRDDTSVSVVFFGSV